MEFCKANSAAITASEIPNLGVEVEELGLTGKKVVGVTRAGKEGIKGTDRRSSSIGKWREREIARTGQVQTNCWSVQLSDCPAPDHHGLIFLLIPFLTIFWLNMRAVVCEGV